MALDSEFDSLSLLEQEAAPYNAISTSYNPGKREREVRRIIWQRYYAMQLDSLRKEAEGDWVAADQAYRMWVPEGSPDDWRANLMLPDAFSAIQVQMQETISRKSRPALARTTDSDRGREKFANAIMKTNMDRTGFDYQFFQAKQAAAIRGTAFLWDYWRTDKRMINDAVSVDSDGKITYKKKEVIDFDDDYAQFIENEFVFIDPAAHHMEDAIDAIVRQVMHIDEFRRVFGNNPDYINIDMVKAGGDTSSKGFFKQQKDMTTYDVEVLRYWNRANDQYWMMANNVVVRTGNMPSKHKEIPLVAVYQYQIPGRFWGMGIPKVIWNLTEERRSIRNLNLDRQKMQINKMFLVNDLFDIDEEEAVVRPHGFIRVNAQGQPLSSVMQPLEYGDVAPSYFQTEEILLDDIRRATGINDPAESNPSGGTATEAAILKESAVKRINLISELQEMDSLTRLGRLKWSNIQFFYPVPRLEKLFEDGEEKTKKIYRNITTKGQEFSLQVDESGKKSLMVNDIAGSTSFKLDKTYATFMGGDYDVTMDADAFATAHVSKAVQQSKITEMLSIVAGQVAWMSQLDPNKSMNRYLEVMQENPDDWMKGNGKSPDEWRQLADWENTIMAQGQPLSPTEDATTDHTTEHLQFTKTKAFDELSMPIKKLFQLHIMGEDKNNPASNGGAGQMNPSFGQEPIPPDGPVPSLGTPQGPGQVQPGQGPIPGQSAPIGSPVAAQGGPMQAPNPMQMQGGPSRGPVQNVQVADIGASNTGQSR